MSGKIPYVDKTWNPILGCFKVSEGCKHCYAEKMAVRLAGMDPEKTDYRHVIDPEISTWNGKVFFAEKQLTKPLKWKQPKVIFVCSMGDFFYPEIPDNWQIAVFNIIEQCPQHTFLLFTKRPDMARVVSMNPFLEQYFELPNIMLVVSMENQDRADRRMPNLLKVPYIRKALSLEPLLSDIRLKPEWLKEIDWVIAGCESGTPHRPMNEDWVRSIRDQVVPWMIPFYFKQKYIGQKKISDPLLDNVAWQQSPDFK